MEIEHRKLNEIRLYENNPRINDEAVDAVARSLEEFGFRQPLVIDEDGVIVVGHTRYKAALKLGLDRVPAHVANDLTPAQQKAYRLADNATGAIASWDTDLLPVELQDLQGMNFDLSLLGFDEDELAAYLDPGVQEGLIDPDDVPQPPDEAITQPGDLWLLGNHRLLCGYLYLTRPHFAVLVALFRRGTQPPVRAPMILLAPANSKNRSFTTRAV